MRKRLLVSADDFGMCHAVNAGTLRAMRAGIVRSTNFLVPCPWFSEALSMAREHSLPVGVHLCVTCEWDQLRWGPVTRAPRLCDELGLLYPGFEPLLASASDADILAEYQAQLERVESLGFTPTHIDTHMLPSSDRSPGALRLKALVTEVARRSGLRYLYETDAAGKLRYFDQELEISGVSWAQVWERLAALGAGTYHLIGHAAEPSPELEAMCSADHPARIWAAPVRVADLAFFTSGDTRRRLHDLGFELITVADL
ncbi:MAG TPA: ChbG/HpnK family deacetylase [Polyangiaceae bacterium]|nr:ChbG/HpnK family deacetylase [Polyangiaceae bacterium]